MSLLRASPPPRTPNGPADPVTTPWGPRGPVRALGLHGCWESPCQRGRGMHPTAPAAASSSGCSWAQEPPWEWAGCHGCIAVVSGVCWQRIHSSAPISYVSYSPLARRQKLLMVFRANDQHGAAGQAM